MSCLIFFLSKANITLKCLSETVYDFEPVIDGMLGFGDNQIIIFPNNGSSFRMAKDNPFQSEILQMLGAHLTSVGPEAIVRSILSCNFDITML